MGGDRIARLREEQKQIWEAQQVCPVHIVYCHNRTRPTPENLLGCKLYTLETAYECLKHERALSGAR